MAKTKHARFNFIVSASTITGENGEKLDHLPFEYFDLTFPEFNYVWNDQFYRLRDAGLCDTFTVDIEYLG